MKRITFSKDGEVFYTAIDGQNVGQWDGKWKSLAPDWEARDDVLAYTGPTVTEKVQTEKLTAIASSLGNSIATTRLQELVAALDSAPEQQEYILEEIKTLTNLWLQHSKKPGSAGKE